MSLKDFVDPKIDRYLDGLLKVLDPVHASLSALARKKSFQTSDGRTVPFPIIGPRIGAIVEQTARAGRVRRVFEFGSGFGYSAYWFARAIGKTGEIYLTDRSEDNLGAAKKQLSRLKNPPRFHFLQGDALEIFESVRGDFDAVFLDLDKKSYPEVLRKSVPRIKTGGFLIADNALWSGKVADPSRSDPETSALRKFNRTIFSHPKLLSTILPVRDGLAVCLKI